MNSNTFLNRELSWLEFNRRVLEEAQDSTVPLLERVKFLAIFSSNLDEFFMIRVATLKRRMHAGEPTSGPDDLTAADSSCSCRPATRIMKNSSRFEAQMARNLSRSRRGQRVLRASPSTRSLKASQEICRLM